jgi:hypothetical protein
MKNYSRKLNLLLLCTALTILSSISIAQDIRYDTLPAITKSYIDRRRVNAIFSNDVLTSVFLSKASFVINKRWENNPNHNNKKPYILDAYINPYINISSSRWTLGKYRGDSIKYEKEKSSYWIFSLFFNPNFEVRIFNDDESFGDRSAPVRTPSYRPGGELFFSHSKIFNTEKSYRSAFSLKGYHHSNGQDGVTINRVDRPWGKRGWVNTYNGDFSDDFVIEFNYLGFWDICKNTLLSYKAGYSHSFGVTDTLAFYNLYSRNRIGFTGSFIKSKDYTLYIRNKSRKDAISNFSAESWRIEFFIGFMVDNFNYGSIFEPRKARFQERLNVHVTGHWRLPGFSEAALFAEIGYYGHDSYNVFFQRNNNFAKLGISFGRIFYPKKTDGFVQKPSEKFYRNKM